MQTHVTFIHSKTHGQSNDRANSLKIITKQTLTKVITYPPWSCYGRIVSALYTSVMWQAYFPLWSALANANQIISCSAAVAYCSDTWHITSRVEKNTRHNLHIGAVHTCTCQCMHSSCGANHHNIEYAEYMHVNNESKHQSVRIWVTLKRLI